MICTRGNFYPFDVNNNIFSWMRKFGITTISEKKMRVLISEWKVGSDVVCELTPFVSVKDKVSVMKAAPMAYVNDLKSNILHYLDLLAQ